MQPPLPDGYVARPPEPGDAPRIAALITASQRAYGDDEPVSAAEVLGDWEGLDLTQEALLVTTDAGDAVAYVDLDNRGDVVIAVYGYVHPTHQQRGIGTALVRWAEDRARGRLDHLAGPDRGLSVIHYAPAEDAGARELLESLGYLPERTIYKMEITLRQVPPAPQATEGVVLRDFVPDHDERATYDLIEAAFLDHWDRARRDFDRWLEMTAGQRMTPDLWQLAEDERSGEVIGACLGSETDGRGWVGPVGVRSDWRRRGVATALLARSFAAYYRRGVREIALSVDSESSTGAPRLYTSAGMQVTRSFIVYCKVLEPARDPPVGPDPRAA